MGMRSLVKRRTPVRMLGPHVESACREIVYQLHNGNASQKQWAVTKILEYMWGKPHQQVRVADHQGDKFTVEVNLVKEIAVKTVELNADDHTTVEQ